MASFLSPTAQLRSGGPLQSGHSVFFPRWPFSQAPSRAPFYFEVEPCRVTGFTPRPCSQGQNDQENGVHLFQPCVFVSRGCWESFSCAANATAFWIPLPWWNLEKEPLLFPWRCSERMKEPLQRQYPAEIGASLTCDSSNNNVHQCSGNAVL